MSTAFVLCARGLCAWGQNSVDSLTSSSASGK